jgi:hypothetical protein
MRLVTDGKLRRLVGRLLKARLESQKAIVFSQFTDTLAYLESVLRAVHSLSRQEWALVTGLLTADVGQTIRQEDVVDLVRRTEVVSGDTEDRDATIHAFAPFYRLGPNRPRAAEASVLEREQRGDAWAAGWKQALTKPIDVLFATDVLAEGVNLQDAALLINFDVHWNPVRMIQRAGRIDRRLNPSIEEAKNFPDLEALAAQLGCKSPVYWWHAHPGAAPVTVNLLLPSELEAELQLRERIANKTLAIDFTLGLEQGTGAEADWMSSYRYQGVSALNAWQGDRAIEQIAGFQQRLRRLLSERGIDPAWVTGWNGWLREVGSAGSDPLIAWALLGRSGGELVEHTRQLQPTMCDGVPHWLWTTEKPVDDEVNAWFVLDGQTWPPATRIDLGWTANASRPVNADDLVYMTARLLGSACEVEELGPEVGLLVQQGATALSRGFLDKLLDQTTTNIAGFRILQSPAERKGDATAAWSSP